MIEVVANKEAKNLPVIGEDGDDTQSDTKEIEFESDIKREAG